ncbi:MAG: hypothetical protein JWO65_2265 [Sphingomonas bacterium]|nr:hypothetical protein [Sphingomonas bacterium]
MPVTPSSSSTFSSRWRRSACHGLVFAAMAHGAIYAPAASAAVAQAVDRSIPSYRPQPVPQPHDRGYIMRDGSIRIIGYDDMADMVARWNAIFAKSHPGIRFTPILKGDGTAIPAITYDTTAFAPEGGGATELELLPYEKIYGSKKDPVAALIIRVAHGSLNSAAKMSPLGIVVNKSNPIKSLTEEQAAAIFATGSGDGDITNWSQIGVGGNLANKPIHPAGLYWDNYMRPEDPNVGEYMMYRKMGAYPGHVFSPNYEQYLHYGEVTKKIASDPQSIGIVALNKVTPDVRVVPILGKDGKALSTGTRAELLANAYPYARDLYIYIRREPGTAFDPLVKEYMRLVLSKEGQEAVAQDVKGYMPLGAADVAKELGKLNAADTWAPRSKQGPKLNFPFPSPFPSGEAEGQ